MFKFSSLTAKIWAINQFFGEGKDRANIKQKAIVITMFFVIIGANLGTSATTITNSEASLTTIAWRPRPAPPAPPNKEGINNQQGSLLT